MKQTEKVRCTKNLLTYMKKKHLETKFLKFLLERQKQLEEDGDVNVPLPEDEEGLPRVRKTLRMKPIDVPIEEEEDEDDIEDEVFTDEEILERLTLKYKILKNEYEDKLRNRKRR
jgi:hypothetical protein